MALTKTPTGKSRPARASRTPPAAKTSSVSGTVGAGLLGRTEQLVELVGLLEAERLVTLSGAPGIGKTRLALALALADQADRGARVVELAPVVRAGDVPRAVASAFSVDEQPGQSVTDTLIATIGTHRRLVVLDNCEHLLGGCAKLIEALLAGCPQVRILATSREALGVDAERVWEVPALAVPEPGDETPDALAGCPAVELFVERAARAQPGFALNAYVGPAVAELCRRLDGIPLAIELAAARVESLTPQEIALRLNDRFGLLSTASDDVVARHQTLQAALDWSHELLTESEQMLLRGLSVFSGSFDVEGAEAVCGDGLGAGQLAGVLGALVSKSLAAGGGEGGRFGLLETIRAYAADRLEQAGQTAAVRAAHARFYLDLAEEAEPDLTGPDQQAWFERLEGERANLRAAIEWSLSHGETEQALRLTGALVLFWRVRCHFSEGREMLEAAVAADDDAAPALRAKGLWGAGFMALMMGDVIGAIPTLEESLALFREAGDDQGCGRTLLLLANCAQSCDEAKGLRLAEESVALARDAGDAWCLAHALGVAGNIHIRRSELVQAGFRLQEAVAVARETEDKQSLRFGLLGLAQGLLLQGDYPLAETLLAEALVVSGELGEDYCTAVALQRLGEMAILQGEYVRARGRLEGAADLYGRVAHVGGSVDALLGLAEVAHCEGDGQLAGRLFEEALAIARAHDGTVVRAVHGLGRLAVEEGRPELAWRLLEEALELARAHGHDGEEADALHGLAELARSERNLRRAAVLHDQVLMLRRAIGSAPKIAASLEAVGGLAAQGGRYVQAARLFGAAQALRARNGYARAPWEAERYEADLSLVRRGVPAAELGASLANGETLSLDEAVAEASMGPGPSGRAVTGWQSLSLREQEVARLVAEGLSNPDVAERLFITRGTVKRHLAHIFGKLGLADRVELAREARRH